MERRRALLYTTPLLPKEYRQVEYIISSGINSIAVYYDNLETIIKADITLTMEKKSHSGFSSFAGSWYGTNEQNQYTLGSSTLIALDASIKRMITHICGAWSKFPQYDGTYPNSAHGELIVDGQTVQRTGTSNLVGSSIIYKSYHLLAAPGEGLGFSGKIYDAKIYNYLTNDLLRDFVPCYRISDGQIGLYDLVTGTFYAGGTGKGEDVKTSGR